MEKKFNSGLEKKLGIKLGKKLNLFVTVSQVLGMSMAPYTPDFKTAFDHFCIHPGGKAVISEVGSQLRLSRQQCLPMLVPFKRYGNTSSSSTWSALIIAHAQLLDRKNVKVKFDHGNPAACGVVWCSSLIFETICGNNALFSNA